MGPKTLSALMMALLQACKGHDHQESIVYVGNLPVVAVKTRIREGAHEVYLELGPREDMEFIRPTWPVGGDL